MGDVRICILIDIFYLIISLFVGLVLTLKKKVSNNIKVLEYESSISDARLYN